MSKLTPKQQAFCDYYIETANATESAVRAGYNKKTARVIGAQNLTKLNIREYIDERLKQKEIERVASQDEVLEFFTSVLRGEVIETIPISLKTQYVMVDKKPSISDRLKAAEDLGKRYGIFKDKVEMTGADGEPLKVIFNVPRPKVDE